MGKKTVILLVMSLMVMSACEKTDRANGCGAQPENYATFGKNLSKEGGKPIEITYRVGHTASDCNNSCIIANGVPSHADCQGSGNACVVTIRLWPIGGQPKGGTFNAVVDTVWSLTTEDYFNMPNRSLTVLNTSSEDKRFLNIPAQQVYRDSVTQQFTFTGLFFSDTAAYSNL